MQIEALFEILDERRPCHELLISEKTLNTAVWNKNYYEACRKDILSRIPCHAREILSIGCGWGATEGILVDKGCQVTAIPLDSVIGRLAEARGIITLPPDFRLSFERLEGTRFDAIILSEMVQHLRSPVDILRKLWTFLKGDGVIVGSVPNLNLSKRIAGLLLRREWAQVDGCFNDMNLHLTTKSRIKKWLKESKLHPIGISYTEDNTRPISRVRSRLPGWVSNSNILFVGKRTSG
jgi:2-polyprenyl-3-methyl-5-hydroxy-6-metoxy-1,4-benzoquinol methylase